MNRLKKGFITLKSIIQTATGWTQTRPKSKDNNHIMTVKLKRSRRMMCTERNGMPCPRTGIRFRRHSVQHRESGRRIQRPKSAGSALNPATAADRAILYTALSLFIGTVFFHLFWYKGIQNS